MHMCSFQHICTRSTRRLQCAVCPGVAPIQWMHLRHARTVAGGAAVIDCFVIFVAMCSACRGRKVMGEWELGFVAHRQFVLGCLARLGNVSCTVEPQGNHQSKAKQNPSHQPV